MSVQSHEDRSRLQAKYRADCVAPEESALGHRWRVRRAHVLREPSSSMPPDCVSDALAELSGGAFVAQHL